MRTTAISMLVGALLLTLTAPLNAQSGTSSVLPADIDPESLSRLRALSRDDLDAQGKAAYDLVIGNGPKPLTGPRMAGMYSPKIAESWHILNEYLRGEGVIGSRLTEVAILVTAWEIEQHYEWSAHEPDALRFGVPQVVIDTIKYDREPVELGREETLIIRLGRQLFREHEVSTELFAEAVELFGERGTVELVTVMGDYVMVGVVLTAINQHIPAGRTDSLPER